MTNLYIPAKIRVGFQERPGTFTGKLAYVTYYDEKNKLRKEGSWNSWRDHNIEPIDFDNTPTNGFLFNKGIQRSSEWFGSGRTVFRVYAPYDFEFEVNGDNLINLLMHSDVSKREILEQCVFAWAGTELILLPVNSVEYQEAVAHTAKQSLKVSAKELIKGAQYHQKKSNEILTYIGHLPWWEFGHMYNKKFSARYRYYSDYQDETRLHECQGKKHIFWNGTNFVTLTPSTLSHAVSNDVVDNYAELVDEFYSTYHSQPVVDIKIVLNEITGQDEPSRWGYYNWPEMCKVENGELIWIDCTMYNYLDHRAQLTFRQLSNFSEYRHKITFGSTPNDSIKTCRIDGNRLGANRSYAWKRTSNTESSGAANFHNTLQQLAIEEGFNYERLLPSQYVTLMTKLGYGEPKHVLQNGQLIKFVGDRY